MFFISIWLLSFLHPFHVSVTSIYYKADDKLVQAEQRIFLDDLEEVLRVMTNNDRLDILEDNRAQISELIGQYVSARFSITSDEKEIEMTYLGFEVEEDENVIWCYFQSERVRRFDTFQVRNTILTEYFEDQEKIVHYKSPDGTQSERTWRQQPWASFD